MSKKNKAKRKASWSQKLIRRLDEVLPQCYTTLQAHPSAQGTTSPDYPALATLNSDCSAVCLVSKTGQVRKGNYVNERWRKACRCAPMRSSATDVSDCLVYAQRACTQSCWGTLLHTGRPLNEENERKNLRQTGNRTCHVATKG